jgi:hypothetical protein
MARIFIEGFEAGALDLWDIDNGAAIIAAKTGMNGNYCLDLKTNGLSFLYKKLPSSYNEIYLSFLYRQETEQTYASSLIFLMNGTTFVLSCRRASDVNHRLQFYRDGWMGVLIAEGSTSIALNTTYRIEVHYKPDATSGILQIKINGSETLDIDFAGNTSSSVTSMDGLMVGNGQGNSFNSSFGFFDDFILDNTAWIHGSIASQIQVIVPTGAGSSSQWTGDYSKVDEKPPDDTDFLETNGADQVHLFQMGDLTGSIDAIKCVQVQARLLSRGAITPKNVQAACRSGGVNYFGSSKQVQEKVPVTAWKLWGTNPNTGSAWVASEVNALEVGVKSVT